MAHSPLDDLEEQELALRAALFGLFAGGVFGAVRNPPRSPFFTRWILQRDSQAILTSRWWRNLWQAGHDRILPLLVRISREAGSAAWREIAAGFSERRARELAVELAGLRAEALIAELTASTADGLQRALFDMRVRELAVVQLRDELAARLGPTRKQLRRIARWEALERAKGTGAVEILRGVRSRVRNATRLRAGIIASDEVVGRVAASRVAVFEEEGVLVFSANVGDDRVEPLDTLQTEVTSASPTPAGQAWTPAAPFSGLMPYHAGCRCWVQAA